MTTVETPVAPSGGKRAVTPNGTIIEFETKPKRRYLVNGEEAVSVTTALEVLDKPALPWWGMTIGVKGVHALIGMGVVRLGYKEGGEPTIVRAVGDVWEEQTPEQLTAALTDIKATVNHVKDDAGKRGQSAHDAFEAWGVTGELPDPKAYTFVEQPYVQALRDFLVQLDFETEGNEVMVASPTYGYAGRYDIRGKLNQSAKVITKTYPKSEPKHTLMEAGNWLLDLKTSKDVYVSHFLQLEAYEGASVECGYRETDFRAVIQVGADGRYQLRIVRGVTQDDYVQIVNTYHVMQRAKEALKV